MHDLVVRNGTVIDGTGMPSRQADVAITEGVITALQPKVGAARRDINAEGLLVLPGWVDIHTHYDALYDFQKFLEPFLKPLVLLSVIGVIPYGIFLLVLNVRRIKRRDFSISILVYHLGSWLGWTATWTICALGQFTYYFR